MFRNIGNSSYYTGIRCQSVLNRRWISQEEPVKFADYLRVNALKHRDRVALIERHAASEQRRTLTWEQFNLKVNKIANYLKKDLKIKRGERILHLFNNSIEWITTYFGIIKIGAVVVPLNFRFIELETTRQNIKTR